MRIDVVTIFPQYLSPLDLSLLGKARATGQLDVRVHDLRDWTRDRHRTVDDTPYGGGPGMVMRPEPWGEALDALLAGGPARLVFPTPAGARFDQSAAERLAAEPRLILAAGRYEGIDQRVIDEYAARVPVDELSLGDFVLNGGEVAVLAIIEAVSRLLPGFMGNPLSVAEESHSGPGERLLEHPVYTKPARWRGREVPEVLLSGDHGRIAGWRREQSLRRTVQRRPDLARPATLVDAAGEPPSLATQADAGELLTLQRACWVTEAQANEALDIPPLVETLADVQAGLRAWTTWVVRVDGRLVASVRARARTDTWEAGRLMVAPDWQRRGLGRALLAFAEAQAPDEATVVALVTGARSGRNLAWYAKAGYRRSGPQPGEAGVVRLEKRLR